MIRSGRPSTVGRDLRTGLRALSFYAENFKFVEFRGLTGWEEIEGALDAVGDDVSGVHVGAAFAQSQKLLPRPPVPFLHGLAERAVKRQRDMDVRSAVIVLQSCTALAFFDPPLVASLCEALREQHLCMDFRAAAKVFHVLGCLRRTWKAHAPTAGLPDREIGALLETLATRLPTLLRIEKCDLRSVTLLMTGVADVGYRHVDVLESIENDLRQRRWSSGSELATTIFATSRLRLTSNDLVERLSHDATSAAWLGRFTDRELATTMYSLHRLGCRTHAVFSKLSAEASRPERLAGYSDRSLSTVLYALRLSSVHPAALEAFQNAFLRGGRLKTCSGQDLVTAVRSFRRRPRSDRGLLTSFSLEAVQPRRLEQWRAPDAAELLFGFAKCDGVWLADRLRPLAERLDSAEALETVAPQLTADAVCALGQLGLTIPPALGRRLESGAWLKGLPLVSMVRILTGLSLSPTPNPALNARCGLEALAPRRMRLYSCKELAAVLRAFGRMRLTTRQFVDPVERTLVADGEFRRFGAADLADLCCALAEARNGGSPTLALVMERALEKETAQKLSLSTLCRLLGVAGGGRASPESCRDAATLLASGKISEAETPAVVSSLCAVRYDGAEWPSLLSKLQAHLESDGPSLAQTKALLHAFSQNAANLRSLLRRVDVLNVLTRALDGFDLSSAEISDIGRLADALTVLDLAPTSLVVKLCDGGRRRVQESAWRGADDARAVASLLGLCFRAQLSHELSSDAESLALALRETVEKDTQFAVAPYLKTALLANLLGLRALEGRLEARLLEVCLDLAAALRAEGVLPTKEDLSKIFLCFLHLRQEGFRPQTSAQAEILKRGEAASSELRSVSCSTRDRVSAASALSKELLGRDLAANAALEDDLPLVVDLLDAERKRVVLFLDASRELRLDGRTETGSAALVRRLLTRAGYDVVAIPEELFDAMGPEEKRSWLRESFGPRLSEGAAAPDRC